MVLLSEYLSATTTLLVISTVLMESVNQDMGQEDTKQYIRCVYPTGTLSIILLTSSFAIRLLLETESPQSMVPAFVAITLVLVSSCPHGRRTLYEWLLRVTFLCTIFICLLLYVSCYGLTEIADTAQSRPLDRELQWYHVFLAPVASYRWLVLSIALFSFPSGMNFCMNIILMVTRVTLLWVLPKATGHATAESPWGVFDELLLDNTSFMNLVFALITYSIVLNHGITAIFSVQDREGGDTTQKLIPWSELKEEVSRFFRNEQQVPQSNDAQENPILGGDDEDQLSRPNSYSSNGNSSTVYSP